MINESLDAYSIVLVYSAIGVYALAFLIFAFDLVKAPQRELRATNSGSQTLGAAAGGGVTTLTRPKAGAKNRTFRRPLLRVGFALTVLAWILHVTATVMRGVAAGRVPWANMYEFALTGVVMIVGVFIFSIFWRDLRFLGVYITGLAVIFLGLGAVNFYVAPIPLPPALQSIWIVIHVFVAVLGTGFFGVGAGISILQLIRDRSAKSRFVSQLPNTVTLEDLAYRLNVIGFIMWTFTLIAGAIWAQAAWGRYWGWDTKEVWTFIIWVIYAGYIHARATRGWRGTRSAWLSLVGFAALIFNFTVVNLFFKGLHAYSGL
ncbi:c-type cytochrome biogenesis protein CcsB [Humidisolicoccus flavus]|uniref:c-type cytochrome biogenesis protein CcsB n=1 Tax=Humidisolicoccus flavus TaxID=3111414 RepID=UPI00324E728D